MTNNWTVRFPEYLKFEGVKEGIEHIKGLAKEQKRSRVRIGDLIEVTMKKLIEDGGLITVDELSPQYDVGFGADFKFNYKKEEKNYSFFVDVTAKIHESTMFFSHRGDLVKDMKDAFCYYTEEFKMFFSVKYSHGGFFRYKKPVIVLIVQEFGLDVDINNVEVSHGTNISNIMIALHEYLCDQGYGARASQHIEPAPHRFHKEFQAYRKEVRDMELAIQSKKFAFSKCFILDGTTVTPINREKEVEALALLTELQQLTTGEEREQVNMMKAFFLPHLVTEEEAILV